MALEISPKVADKIFPRYLDDNMSLNYIERISQSELLSKYLLKERANVLC